MSQPAALSTSSLLQGWLSTFHVDYQGKRLGPYHRRCWKVNGKLKMEYVKPNDLERVRAACQAYRDRRKRRTTVARDFHNRISNINWLDRMAKRLRKGDLRPEDYAFCEVVDKEGITAAGRPKLRNAPPRTSPLNTQRLTLKDFMYPSHTKLPEKFWKQTRQDFISIKKQMLDKESEDEKWERWRKEHAQMPEPRPLPVSAPPACISEQRLEEAVAELLRHVEGLEPEA